MFSCALLYIFMMFPSLKFPCNFFLYHLSSDLQAFEVGRFFPVPASCEFIICVLGTPFDAGGSSVHSITYILYGLVNCTHVPWLWGEQTVLSLHD